MKTLKQMAEGIMKNFLLLFLFLASAVVFFPWNTLAATRSVINRDVNVALDQLYRTSPEAKKISKISKGILVFPSIIKGAFVVGGDYGEGALRINGKTVGYYNTVSASYGLEAGAQSFGYALFFLDDESLNYLKKSDGWELGTVPNLVVVDQGIARNLSSTTYNTGIYAFIFNQKGLMAGISIEGSKITRIHPK